MSPSPSDPVERLVSGPIVEAHTDDTLNRLAELMVEDSIGLVVIRDQNPVLGVVSERDIVRAVAEGLDFESDRAADVMALETVSIDASASIAQAASMMIDGGMRHLPVMKGEKVVGVVSIRDLLAAHTD
ncbi:MAG: CBS domain-containing protein [Actinomycetia bacterium]|nr:CBS domain-containing protein [Actinomycetes bacterium]